MEERRETGGRGGRQRGRVGGMGKGGWGGTYQELLDKSELGKKCVCVWGGVIRNVEKL